MRLTVVVPAYNEGKTITVILSKLLEVELINKIEKEIIVVDDCSVDNTEEVVKRFISDNADVNIRYFKHEKNRGKELL